MKTRHPVLLVPLMLLTVFLFASCTWVTDPASIAPNQGIAVEPTGTLASPTTTPTEDPTAVPLTPTRPDEKSEQAPTAKSDTARPDLELAAPDIDTATELIMRGDCQACHVIPGIDAAVGMVGPNWCEAAKGFQAGEIDAAFLYGSITQPNADVTEGYAANVMPRGFDEIYNEGELDALVAFIAALPCDE